MMGLRSNLRLACGVASASLAFAGAVSAQPAVAPATPASSSTVETVVVTAEKRSENVQNVAGQVTALSGANLETMHANDFSDFAHTIPGVSYFSGGPTNDLIAIRGITTGGTQLGSAVGIYLDDVPVGASTQFGLGFQSLNINTYDLSRVEVLNGPQGTLYGANALGGTIRYITAPPNPNHFSADAEVEGSGTDHGSGNDAIRLMANVPLIEDRLALRIDGVQQFDSGYAQDPDHDRSGVGAARTIGGRVSLLAKVTPDLDVRLTAFSQRINGSGADVSFRDPTTHAPVEGPYDQSYPLSQPSQSSLDLYSAEVNYHLPWATLTSVTAYQDNRGSYQADDSALYDALLGGLSDPFDLAVYDTTKKVTQEARLTSRNNKTFEWVIGGYYDFERTSENVFLLDKTTPAGTLEGLLPFSGMLPSTYREGAVFADGTYYVTDKLDLTLGVRYSQQHQTYESNIESLFVVDPGVTNHYASGSNQGTTTYLINPRYHVTHDVMVYARISSGFRPGGPNFVLPGGEAPPVFQPDTLWNYEVGEKSTLLHGRATLDVDYYHIDWSKVQTTVNVSGINQLINAGNAKVDGAEAAFSYKVIPPLTLSGTFAYTDARLTTPSPEIGITYSGAPLPLSPRYDFALDANYAVQFGPDYHGLATISEVYVGDRNAGYPGAEAFVGNPLYKLASYNTVNLSFALYMPRNIEVDAFVKNVFDTRGEVSASTINNQYFPSAPVPVYLSQPLTGGMVFKVHFDG